MILDHEEAAVELKKKAKRDKKRKQPSDGAPLSGLGVSSVVPIEDLAQAKARLLRTLLPPSEDAPTIVAGTEAAMAGTGAAMAGTEAAMAGTGAATIGEQELRASPRGGHGHRAG